jgi:hypothetical protein
MRRKLKEQQILILCFMKPMTLNALETVKLIWWLKSNEKVKYAPRSLIIPPIGEPFIR